jgi:DNA-binding CsgD family transcriptional regulator
VPFDSVDKWRDEDEDESFWRRAGVHELITPELRKAIDAKKAERPVTEIEMEGRLRGGHKLSARAPHHALSEREKEVIRLAAAGLGNPEIGAALHLGLQTVKTYLKTATRKLAARNRAHLVALGYELGVLQPGDTPVSSIDERNTP